MANQDLRRVVGSAWLVASGIVAVGACNHAWSALDPVATAASASGASATGASTGASTGATGSGGAGGATSSASSGGASASSSASSSTGAGGADAGTTHCGGTDLLSWDFTSNQGYVFLHSGGTSLMGGVGTIAFPTTMGGYWEQSYSTARVYDLRGDRVFVKVPAVPPSGSQGELQLKLGYDNGDSLFLREWKGNMYCGSSHKTMESASASPYDQSTQVYWQLREDQGLIHCETSPDGLTWKVIDTIDLSVTVLSPPSAIHVALDGVINGANTVAGTGEFDDLNGGGAPTGHWCPASTFTDGFSATAPVPDPGWDRSYANAPASFDQLGGTLNLHEVALSNVGYTSSASFDATGERVSVEVLAAPTSAEGTASFRLNDATGWVGWSLHSDSSFCSFNTPMGSGTIWQGQLPPFPAHVGVREEGGFIYCTLLQPTDGGPPVWKDLGSFQMGLDITALDVSFFVYGTSTNAATWVASFDDYNLPPVP